MADLALSPPFFRVLRPALFVVVVVAVVTVFAAGCGARAQTAERTAASTVAGAESSVSTTATSTDTAISAQEPGSAGASSGALDPVVPAALAHLSLREYLDGTSALAQVEQLHGKALGAGFDRAWLASYGDQQATVWISRSVRLADAQQLTERMKAKIAQGNSPFKNPRTFSVSGVTVFALDGMGQQHYYFRLGRDLYWLAIAPSAAQAGLEELIANGLRVQAEQTGATSGG